MAIYQSGLTSAGICSDPLRLTILATPAPGCPACDARRSHAGAERRTYHPFAGHGTNDGKTWSHPDLDPKKGVA